MAKETKKEYSRYVYQVLKDAAVVATFCTKQDAEEMAAEVGGEVYVIGAY
jgi:hypothetical protein